MHALEAWLHYSKIDFVPVFRWVYRENAGIGTERLFDKHVIRPIKRLLLETGVGQDRPALAKLSDAKRVNFFAGHSLGAGLAGSAEVDKRYVPKQLGHASAEVTGRYQRRRDRFRVNLTKAAGLRVHICGLSTGVRTADPSKSDSVWKRTSIMQHPFASRPCALMQTTVFGGSCSKRPYRGAARLKGRQT